MGICRPRTGGPTFVAAVLQFKQARHHDCIAPFTRPRGHQRPTYENSTVDWQVKMVPGDALACGTAALGGALHTGKSSAAG